MASTTTETTGVAAAEAAAVQPARKRNVKPYLIVGGIVAVLGGAYGVYSVATRGQESTDDAQVDADIVPVSARVSGTVLHVHVSDNQIVKKGDLLVEIDPADLTAREKQAEAELAAAGAQADAADAQVSIVAATSKGGLSSARAQLSGSAMSLASADAQIGSARAALERTRAEAARADDDLNRGLSLLKDQAIPKAQVDAAKATADAAHAAVAQAESQLAESQDMKRTAATRIAEAQGHVEQSAPVEAQLAAARANADLAHARVASAQAELDQAKLQLSYTKIEAPADGLLSKLDVHEGQLLQAGQPIVNVVPSVTYVTANFKETQVGEMHQGLRVSITVDAYPGRKFDGTIQSTSPGTGARFSLLPADNATGNFVKVVQRVPVKIAWTSLPGDVHPAAGMSADVTVYTR